MDATQKMIGDKLLIGRNEWCELPDLQVPAIKAKIDTGAKTSALHALNIENKNEQGVDVVYFDVNPIQGNDELLVHCKAPIIDERYIMSSNGQKEHRYVINTAFKIGGQCWQIELTLSNRDPLKYRMLLGREALRSRVFIDPGETCNQGKVTQKHLRTIYPLSEK